MSTIRNLKDFERFISESKILSKYHIRELGIFGSFARKEPNFNDIDILLEQDIDYKSALSFKEEIEKKTNRKVDLVLGKYANPIILHRAKKDMVYVKE